MAQARSPWQPRSILYTIRSLATATATVLVQTDQGEGYLKAMGNPEGPHVLACEWVGSQLARRLGLPTFIDFALIEVSRFDGNGWSTGEGEGGAVTSGCTADANSHVGGCGGEHETNPSQRAS